MHCVAFLLGTSFATEALETLERPGSRHQGKYSMLPSSFAFVHPERCDLQWVPPTPPPPHPQAQVPMTRQKAPWARRAGAGWGPGGERRHTPSGGKPVPARWGVRGGGEPGANGRVTQRLEFTTQVRPPGRGCPQSVRGRERESAPLQEEGAPAPSATFLFLFFGALGERASREEAEDSPGPARESGPAGA